jgi:hypothetical protein
MHRREEGKGGDTRDAHRERDLEKRSPLLFNDNMPGVALLDDIFYFLK